MSLFARLVAAWSDARRREAEIAAIAQSDLDGLGISRADLAAIAAMPDEQLARMERMAALFGVPEGALDATPGLRAEVARTCANCPENSLCRQEMAHGAVAEHAEMFCPNAGTYAELARRADDPAG